jgi:hypothetical protein
MRLKFIETVLRENGFFHFRGRQIKAYYPRRGYAVMLFLEDSPIDRDFEAYVWVPSVKDLQNIKKALEKSDRLTHQLLGRGWNYGIRPYLQVGDFL